jgi:hypothetical protein
LPQNFINSIKYGCAYVHILKTRKFLLGSVWEFWCLISFQTGSFQLFMLNKPNYIFPFKSQKICDTFYYSFQEDFQRICLLEKIYFFYNWKHLRENLGFQFEKCVFSYALHLGWICSGVSYDGENSFSVMNFWFWRNDYGKMI